MYLTQCLTCINSKLWFKSELIRPIDFPSPAATRLTSTGQGTSGVLQAFKIGTEEGLH